MKSLSSLLIESLEDAMSFDELLSEFNNSDIKYAASGNKYSATIGKSKISFKKLSSKLVEYDDEQYSIPEFWDEVVTMLNEDLESSQPERFPHELLHFIFANEYRATTSKLIREYYPDWSEQQVHVAELQYEQLLQKVRRHSNTFDETFALEVIAHLQDCKYEDITELTRNGDDWDYKYRNMSRTLFGHALDYYATFGHHVNANVNENFINESVKFANVINTSRMKTAQVNTILKFFDDEHIPYNVTKDSIEYNIKDIKDKAMKKLSELINESLVSENYVITSKSEFEDYATNLLKQAHGSNFDESKAQKVIDGIVKDTDGDWGKAVGILKKSLGK